MAVIHQMKVPGALGDLADIIKDSIANDMWSWFALNQDTVVVDLRVFKLIHVKVTVSQLKGLFETLFGARHE